MEQWSRRDFLRSGCAVAGGLMLASRANATRLADDVLVIDAGGSNVVLVSSEGEAVLIGAARPSMRVTCCASLRVRRGELSFLRSSIRTVIPRTPA